MIDVLLLQLLLMVIILLLPSSIAMLVAARPRRSILISMMIHHLIHNKSFYLLQVARFVLPSIRPSGPFGHAHVHTIHTTEFPSKTQGQTVTAVLLSLEEIKIHGFPCPMH